MAKFGKTSTARLNTCDECLQAICHAVIPYYDFTVLCGHRNLHQQTAAFVAGRSKVEWPNSKHNSQPSLAVDIAPWPIDWDDLGRFYYLAGRMKMAANVHEVTLRWGGDWRGRLAYNGAAAFYIAMGEDYQEYENTPDLNNRHLWKWSREAAPDPDIFFDGPHFEIVE